MLLIIDEHVDVHVTVYDTLYTRCGVYYMTHQAAGSGLFFEDNYDPCFMEVSIQSPCVL